MTFFFFFFFPVQQTTSGIDHRVKKFFRVGNQYAESEDIFFPLTEGCSEGLDAFRFFFKQEQLTQILPPEGGKDKQISPCSRARWLSSDLKFIIYRFELRQIHVWYNMNGI